MVAARDLVVPLDATVCGDEALVGGKAAKLARLLEAGYRVPPGFCITTAAYEEFVRDSRITQAIRMELGRKSLDEMRWEEIWDAALRIRLAFLDRPLSQELEQALRAAVGTLGASAALAVRSSAPGEDSAGRSFAGLHESIIGVRGERALADAVRVVWASLWSDAALLYRRELGLDPVRSRMAVVVQEMVEEDRSGVAFGRDPRDMTRPHAVVEAVPGRCESLVDGTVDPDRWELHRESRSVVVWLPGSREDGDEHEPLLDPADLERLLDTLLAVEDLFDWAPDIEWTGRSTALSILQARPITTAAKDPDDKRDWYLTLRPGDERLRRLRDRVSTELIPQLEAEGESFATEALADYDDDRVADAIEARQRALEKWRKVYWDEFIPLAHGVRRLGTFYNDAVRPDDPYEFVGLLRDQPLQAAERNAAIAGLARRLAANEGLAAALGEWLDTHPEDASFDSLHERCHELPEAQAFFDEFDELRRRFLDVAFDHVRLSDHPVAMLRTIAELARSPGEPHRGTPSAVRASADLEERLLTAVGAERREEALEWIETGRVSWRLRDDDNLLLGRVESQLLRALAVAAARLRAAGRTVGDAEPLEAHAGAIVDALRDPAAGPVVLEPQPEEPSGRSIASSAEPLEQGTPRQLLGQPASPGLATGPVRRIRRESDLGRFRRGDVLVCDAIQPTMTHLVPLASAIVERRGGMLIHGAIIARELGIPCVNGVRSAIESVADGDIVTVDGHLGIVSVGEPEFDLEWRDLEKS